MVSSFIIKATVITIVNYDRHLFIVQATDQPLEMDKFKLTGLKWAEFSTLETCVHVYRAHLLQQQNGIS